MLPIQRFTVKAICGGLRQRLEDHAIAFRQFGQRVDALLRLVGVADRTPAGCRKTDRRVLGDAERAAKIQIAFGAHGAALEPELQRGRHGLQRDAGAGDQASSSMSPEQACMPVPPVAGCNPASTSAREVETLQASPSPEMSPCA